MIPGFHDAATLADGTRLTPEVCVIGSGAGGAVSAALLSGAGKEVLVVEEGGHRTRRDFDMREDHALARLYQEGGARSTSDGGMAILQGRTVGGSTVINWTTCFRTPERVLEHWRSAHGITGLSAADLLPHFLAVEERLSIAEYPLEQANRNNRLLYDGAKAIGYAPEVLRRNVKRCMRTGYCGTGCPVDAKQSMLITYLPDAVKKGASVLYKCRVERLEIAAGKVLRAHGTVLGSDGKTPTGARVVVEARRFIVAAGAMNSPAVLLRSGLGGGGSPLGRRTFLHPTVGTTAHYRDTVEAYYGPPQSVACHALAERGDGAGVFLEAAPMQPVSAALVTSGFGAEHHARMRELPDTACHLAITIDGFHPSENGGTVSLRPSGAPAIDYPIPERIFGAAREGLRALVRINLAAGADVVRSGHEPALEFRSEADLAKLDGARFESGAISVFSAHVMGGCGMGDDPARSVVRAADLRHHTVENLHVFDGSALPTSLGVNPQETIYGLSHLMTSRLLSTIG